MKKPTVDRLIELQQLLLRFNNLERFVRHSGRKESDTEHSYSLAMAGWFLAQYFPDLDTNKVLKLALAHDLVELHAGDTFAYATGKIQASKAAREKAALEKLTSDWPDFPEMLANIVEYEKRDSAEAKFVYALDKIMPALLNYLNQGDIWRMYNITFEQYVAEKEAKVPVSPEIYVYYKELTIILQAHPEYFSPSEKPSQQG